MDEQTLLDQVDAILGPEGLAVRDGLRHNPQQHDYARRIGKTLFRYDAEQKKTALGMFQAATGLGKTIGYLVPGFLYAAQTGERMAISTYTRHLQRQILEKDAPLVSRWVEELTRRYLNVQRRLGKINYLAASKCLSLRDSMTTDDATAHAASIDLLSDMLDWMNDPEASGILDDFMAQHALDTLPAGMAANMLGLDSSADEQDGLRYQRDLERSKGADVVIVNHALLVLHAFRWGALLDSDEDEGRVTRVAILDEADRFPDAAETILSDATPLKHLESVAGCIEGAGLLGTGRSVADEIAQLNEFLREYRTRDAMLPVSRIEGLPQRLEALARRLEKASAHVRQRPDLFSNTEQSRVPVSQVLGFLDAANDFIRVVDTVSSQGAALISWSPVRYYPSILVGSPDAGRILSRLWAPQGDGAYPERPLLTAAVFTSATLSIPGRGIPEAFDDFASSVGVVRHAPRHGLTPIHNVQTDLMKAYQPTRFGTLRFVLADPRIPNPTTRVEDIPQDAPVSSHPGWLDYCAAMVRAAHNQGGRTLVLTLSWRDTQALEKCLADLPGLRAHQRGESLRSVLQEYRDTERAVLVTPAGWEGIDLPGLVQQLVITRIPYLPPNRHEHLRLELHLRNRGLSGDAIKAILHKRDHNTMRRKLEQGLGRGIRKPDDDCMIWLADPRFPPPEHWLDSLDPVLMEAPSRQVNAALRLSIPVRFRESSYPEAQMLLADGTLHAVED